MTVQKTSGPNNIAERIFSLRKHFASNGTQDFMKQQAFRVAVQQQAEDTFKKLSEDELLRQQYVNGSGAAAPQAGWTINGNWSADKH